MPSNPSKIFEHNASQHTQHAHDSDQHSLAPDSNQPPTARAALHTSYPATSSQASSYNSFYPWYQHDTISPTYLHSSSQNNLSSSQLIPPRSNIQSQFAPTMMPQRASADAFYRADLPNTVDHSYSSLDYATLEAHQDSTEVRRTSGEAVMARSSMNRLPESSLPKKRGDYGAPGRAKRFRVDDQRGLLGSSSTSNEWDRGRVSHSEGFSREPYELVSSTRRSSVRNDSRSRVAQIQGAHSPPARGFFSYSSNNVLEQPIMVDNSQQHTVDNSQHHHFQSDQPDGTLLWLKDYIMEGAEFDSSERDPPPRCHPNTRASIIERMLGWIQDPHRGEKMRWVRGTAGVGKSAIIQTVFESLPEDIRGGSVFFSRPNGRNNPNQVFPSFAYQLAVRDLSYRAYLKELMLKDPRSLCKSMKEQFRILFYEPFANRKLLDGQADLVIALDGLDECGGDPTFDATNPALSRGRSSESAQREIVELISDFIQQSPSVPLMWIIASRPEKHLQVTFASEKVGSIFSEEEVPVDSEEACQDVERYLNTEFTRIRKDHDDLITTTPWPSSKDFSLITMKASGLFIFAQVLIRFIDDTNPLQQLKYALAAISKASTSNIVKNPLIFLDAMYMEIVSKVPLEFLEPATKIIGTIVLCDQKHIVKVTANLPTICNILNIPKDVALTALRHLHSVLFFPKNITSTRPSFYHASFSDFLEDESRSHEYSINETKIGDDLAEGLMRFYLQKPSDNGPLPWPQTRGPQFLVQMAEDMFPLLGGLLVFKARIFFSDFRVSETRHPLRMVHHLATNLSSVPRLRLPGYVSQILGAYPSSPIWVKCEQLGIACHRPLDSLGITHDAVSKCLIVFRKDFCLISLNQPRSFGDENENIVVLREILCYWIERKPQWSMSLWGHEQFKRLAVLPSLYSCFIDDLRLAEFSSRFSRLCLQDLNWPTLMVGF